MKLAERIIILYEESIPLKIPVIRRDVLEFIWPEKLRPEQYKVALERQSLYSLIIFNLHTKSILGEDTTSLSKLVKGFDRSDIYKVYKDVVADAKRAMKSEDIF